MLKQNCIGWTLCSPAKPAPRAVSALNEAAGSPVAVDEELYNLLQTAAEYSALTDGAFAVTVAPIIGTPG